MNEYEHVKYGGLSLTRQIHAPRETVYEAWTQLEHRRHWFVGSAWTEIRRSLDLKTNGIAIAHDQFEDGTETIYTVRFHLKWSFESIFVLRGIDGVSHYSTRSLI